MQITIDTANDSPDSIKKAIDLLQSIVGEKAFTNSAEAAKPMDIFGASGAGIFAGAEDKPSADIFASTEPKPTGESLSAIGMFDMPCQASTPIQIIADQPAQQPQAKSDDEPIGDEELFADLFSKEELDRMAPKKQERQEKPYSKVYF